MQNTNQTVAIEASGVSKIYSRGSPLQAMLGRAVSGANTARDRSVTAVRELSFVITPGESVAIIGRNGSGKSTLLEIIAGTVTPTTGFVRSTGRVAALLELGSGFDPGLSGSDNVMMNGLLLGLSKQEIRARFSEIVAFADIGDVLDRPVSTYSSGMLVRLAFAVQVALDPEILIVDEALSVGDFFFQQKCATLIKKLRDRGVTLLFVSHDMALVRDLCTRALLLEAGSLVFDGEVGEASRRYYASSSATLAAPGTASSSLAMTEFATTTNNAAEPALPEHEARLSVREAAQGALWSRTDTAIEATEKIATLLSVSILDARQQPALSFRMGDQATVRVAYVVESEMPVHVSVEITNRLGLLVTCVGTYSRQIDVNRESSDGWRICDVSLTLDVEAGEYGFGVVLATVNGSANLGAVVDRAPSLGPLRVNWDYGNDVAPHLGLVGLPYQVAFRAAVE
jgi:lipopolysaccharide transport system ATP-binding protein